MDKVDIILPTYNGELYINQLLDSILSQDYKSFNILIRDDMSRDKTLEILNRYEKQYPESVTIIRDNLGNLGVVRNIFEILKYSTSKYIMLCDQDDVWFKNKIFLLLKCIKKIEIDLNEQPILVHSEAMVVDEKLRIMDRSFSHYSGLNRRRSSLCNLLQKNVVQGASSIFNRNLLDIAKPLIELNPKIKVTGYHDLWFAVLATLFGKLYYYPATLMYYRQHSRNLVGAKEKLKLMEFFCMPMKSIDNFKDSHYLYSFSNFCYLLLKLYKNKLNNDQKNIINHYYNNPLDTIEFFKLHLYRYYNVKDILLMITFGVNKR